MESGTARINHGVGAIDARNPPSPVNFAPSSFPSIVDGMEVYFERGSPGSAWATQVVPHAPVDELTAIATLDSGFTRAGSSMIVRDAARSLAEAQVAPAPELARAHLAAAEERMAALAALKQGDTLVGVAAVRKLLGALGRRAD